MISYCKISVKSFMENKHKEEAGKWVTTFWK